MRQPQLGFVCIVEWCGFSVITERTMGETRTLQQACVVFLFFPPYTILLVQWKVRGRDYDRAPWSRVPAGTLGQCNKIHHLDSVLGCQFGDIEELWGRNWPLIVKETVESGAK